MANVSFELSDAVDILGVQRSFFGTYEKFRKRTGNVNHVEELCDILYNCSTHMRCCTERRHRFRSVWLG